MLFSRFRDPEFPGSLPGSMKALVSASSWNTPSCTSKKLSKVAPSYVTKNTLSKFTYLIFL